MELTENEYHILESIDSGQAEIGMSLSSLIDFCEFNFNANPKPLIDVGYIEINPDLNGLTTKGKEALKAFYNKRI